MQLFAYIAALLAYLWAVLIGLVLCLLAAAHPPWRLAAKRLAVAMASSVPGVLLFQIIAAPFVALAAATAVGVHSVVGELHGASQALFASVFLLSTLGVFAAASLLGFLVGWRVGYRIGSGVPIGSALRASRVLSYPRRLLARHRGQSAA